MLVPNLLLVDFGFEVPAFAFKKLEDFVSAGDFSSPTWAGRDAPAEVRLQGVRSSRRIVEVSKRNGRAMASLTCAAAILGIGIPTCDALAGCNGLDRSTS